MVAKGSAASTPAAADKSTKKAAATKKSSAAGKTAAKKTAKKTTAKKAAQKKQGRAAAKGEAPAKKTSAKKTASKKASAKKAPAKKAAPRKTAAKKAAAPKRAAKKTTAKKQTTGAEKVAAKKTPVAKADKVPTARAVAAQPGELAVRAGEEPWTPEEVEEARSELQSEAQRLRDELVASGEALDGLMRDSGDGAGDDDADTGTKNITREHEMALAANAREMLYQTERAIERLDAGTYGLCENCGNPIGKARMQAFPRATLCVECKQQQERR
ncbi:DNA-binding protein [Streptomyces bathyalis]|uniref:DNA-binding protein n=1 Tax=Streptomyces bathyalis TaxID=2710756 RepID=A0A7T1TAG0_9ACTN|nr:TraR/DksA C4-type zinc finger protein [Streptomyces bathyalis]QPP09344.1 DNA-binding protein [Streptomyces bathyalis]